MSDSNETHPNIKVLEAYIRETSVALLELRDDMRAVTMNTDALPRIGTAIDLLADKIESTNRDILEAAIGKEHIPLATVQSLFAEISKNNATLYRVFGAIAIGLLGVILFLLVGERFDWIRELFRNY